VQDTDKRLEILCISFLKTSLAW